MKRLETILIDDWSASIPHEVQERAVNALENGQVLFLPNLPFELLENEKIFLSTAKVDPKSKNVSYDIKQDRLAGTLHEGSKKHELKEMIRRYAVASKTVLLQLIPHYSDSLIQGKTSFRPVEIAGRKSSYRKDDTRLHVDAFPSNPTKGRRILRIFNNINPDGKPRVWRLGEPFPDVVNKFLPQSRGPIPGVSTLYKLLGITKDYRTPYDHHMLRMHNKMKKNNRYQREVSQEEVQFPPGCTWMVYTDQVSHAAISGQHVLEQTFHLPIQGLKNEETAPVRILERTLNKVLV